MDCIDVDTDTGAASAGDDAEAPADGGSKASDDPDGLSDRPVLRNGRGVIGTPT